MQHLDVELIKLIKLNYDAVRRGRGDGRRSRPRRRRPRRLVGRWRLIRTSVARLEYVVGFNGWQLNIWR